MPFLPSLLALADVQLHQTHLDKMSLPYESSEAGLHVPYLIKPTVESLDASVQSWAKHCGAEVVDQHSRRSNDKRSVVYYNSERGSSQYDSSRCTDNRC